MNLAARRRPALSTRGLREIGTRPPLVDYLSQLWGRRHFIVADSRARAQTSNRQMLLGSAWLVLKPLLDGLAFYLIFALLLKTDRGVENFVGFLLIGVFMFQFTQRCLTTGAASVTSNRGLIRSFTFPRASLPIAGVLRELFSTGPVLLTMAVLIVTIPPHAEITWRWLLFPAVLALQTMFNLGLAFFAGRIIFRVPDLNHAISFLTRFWIYGSGVFFSLDHFVNHAGLLHVMQLNPLFVILDITRDLLLYGITPSTGSWITLTLWATVLPLAGLVFFWRGEESYGRG